jgi:hypothetical protein
MPFRLTVQIKAKEGIKKGKTPFGAFVVRDSDAVSRWFMPET